MAALTLSNLTKVYANGTSALNSINLAVEEGDFFALLGPNGAGKSTTLGIICSLVNKTSGSVIVHGYDLNKQPAIAKKFIGLVPQEFNFSIFETPYNILVNQAGYYGIPRKLAKQRTEFYLKKLDLWDKRHQPSRSLSGGMKRRLMIARALVHEPKLLILDEPTAGVDIELRRSMWEFLKELNNQGTTIILTTHYLEEAESLCRNIAIIDKGNIIANTSMKALLQTLQTEVFVLYLTQPLTQLPIVNNYQLRLIDNSTLEATIISKQQTLNQLFELLSQHGLTVGSMRSKANRLEELFLQLVGHAFG